MSKHRIDCPLCKGFGYKLKLTSTGGMIKRRCPVCRGDGKVSVKSEGAEK